MSSSSNSHMPRSIFPDIPASKRAFTTSPNYSDTGGAQRPTNSRRHTAATLPLRREPRPLRSSPLAGPSLALTQEGTITEEPSPMASGFEACSQAYAADAIVDSPVNDSASPTSSVSDHAFSAPVTHMQNESPSDSSMSSRFRRLSLGFKRRSFSTLPAQQDVSSTTPRTRRLSSSSSHSQYRVPPAAPPVPEMPQWARSASDTRSLSNPPSPTEKRGPHHRRRPSTSPSTTVDRSAKRLSMASTQSPSTSRNPEENWLTSASAPRFSRLGIKGDGVVMPVSVKEARRRSTASVSSRASADTRNIKSKQSARSLQSVHNPNGETARRIAEDAEMHLPRPWARSDASFSSSSLGSSVGDANSIMTEMRSISRISSMTDGDLLPVPSHHGEESGSSSTLELRINDVTIDKINYQLEERIIHPSPLPETKTPAIQVVEDEGQELESTDVQSSTKVKRKGTLKKVWNRVVKSVTG